MIERLPNTVDELAEAVRSIEEGCGPVGGSSESTGSGPPLVLTGWAPVDAEIGGGLPAGAVHEWFAGEEGIRPLGVLGHLAAQAVGEGEGTERWAIWIGGACWPHPLTLSAGLRRRSLFVAPPDREKRLWAAELAARSPAVGVVVAEGERLTMAATRRLQLAARAEYGVKGVPACLVVGADGTVIHRSRSMGQAKHVIAEALEPTNGHTNCLVSEPPESRTRSTLGLANYSFSAG